MVNNRKVVGIVLLLGVILLIASVVNASSNALADNMYLNIAIAKNGAIRVVQSVSDVKNNETHDVLLNSKSVAFLQTLYNDVAELKSVNNALVKRVAELEAKVAGMTPSDPPPSGDLTKFYWDEDQDGYGVSTNYKLLTEPAEYYTATVGGDFTDNNAEIYPGAEEKCNGLDDDCDGLIDENWPQLGSACHECGHGIYVCNPDGSGPICNLKLEGTCGGN